MEVFEAIKNRRSIRKYKPGEIPEEHLQMILESARLAPSAHNWQPWKLIVVRGAERRRQLTMASTQPFIGDAGCIIIALSDPECRPTTGPGARPSSHWVGRNIEWHKMDVMIAIENMILTSESLGYGTCWIGTFDEDEVKAICKIPEKMNVVSLLPIGVPDEAPDARPRKEIEEIAYSEEYGREWSYCLSSKDVRETL